MRRKAALECGALAPHSKRCSEQLYEFGAKRVPVHFAALLSYDDVKHPIPSGSDRRDKLRLSTFVRLTGSLLAVLPLGCLLGQQQPMNWTAAEDHKNMMDQLGIKALRPGPSGNESLPNHANYDESLANPFPNLPDVLTLMNGKKVTTAEMWWKERRPEIVEDFEREVIGRVPDGVPKVTWEVSNTVTTTVGSRAVTGKRLVGHVDNASFPAISVDIQMTLVTPADATAPVPVMMMFGRAALPGDPVPAGRGESVTRLNWLWLKSRPPMMARIAAFELSRATNPVCKYSGLGSGVESSSPLRRCLKSASY